MDRMRDKILRWDRLLGHKVCLERIPSYRVVIRPHLKQLPPSIGWEIPPT